jgi:hypothetical protein
MPNEVEVKAVATGQGDGGSAPCRSASLSASRGRVTRIGALAAEHPG